MVSLSLAFLAPIVLTGLLVKYRPADHEPPLFVPVSIVLVSYLPIAVIALLYAGVVLVDQRHLGNPVSNWAQGLLYLMVLLPPWLSFAGSIIAAGLLLSGRGSWKWNVAVLFVSVADLMLAASVVPSALGLS